MSTCQPRVSGFLRKGEGRQAGSELWVAQQGLLSVFERGRAGVRPSSVPANTEETGSRGVGDGQRSVVFADLAPRIQGS